MTSIHLDQQVGRVAGAIFSDINTEFSYPPLMLVPALTFKVKKILEQVPDFDHLTDTEKEDLAREIRVSVIPMLFSYEIEPKKIEKISPLIESAALKVLSNEIQYHA